MRRFSVLLESGPLASADELLEPQFNNPKDVGSSHRTLWTAMSLSGVLADSQGSSKERTINTNISVTKMPSMASVLWWVVVCPASLLSVSGVP